MVEELNEGDDMDIDDAQRRVNRSSGISVAVYIDREYAMNGACMVLSGASPVDVTEKTAGGKTMFEVRSGAQSASSLNIFLPACPGQTLCRVPVNSRIPLDIVTSVPSVNRACNR